jgi:outer membrane protein assembly factor BamB
MRSAFFVLLLLASCAYFEPDVGPLLPACEAEGGTTSDAVYGSSAVSGCTASSTRVSGNVLIADQVNNRVIELTRAGDIVWSFGDGKSVPGPTSVVAPNDAERLPNGRTLISGSGAPPGLESTCPASNPAGCPDNRVLIVDDGTGAIVWQYGADRGISGSGSDQLNTPVAAVFVPTNAGGNILITDQGNNRIIEVSEQTKETLWQFPTPLSKENLTLPDSAERLGNGHTLIADEGGNRVIEIDVDGAIVWQYPPQIDRTLLNSPGFASRLPDGDTLITDTNNNRVLEVDMGTPPKVVWTYSTANRNPLVRSPNPTHAVRLANGDTLIVDQFNDQVIEVTPSTGPYIDYSYGKLGVAGRGVGELDAPYDAKVVGDYTGLTPPM